jgi:hypothetical protein
MHLATFALFFFGIFGLSLDKAEERATGALDQEFHCFLPLSLTSTDN